MEGGGGGQKESGHGRGRGGKQWENVVPQHSTGQQTCESPAWWAGLRAAGRWAVQSIHHKLAWAEGRGRATRFVALLLNLLSSRISSARGWSLHHLKWNGSDDAGQGLMWVAPLMPDPSFFMSLLHDSGIHLCNHTSVDFYFYFLEVWGRVLIAQWNLPACSSVLPSYCLLCLLYGVFLPI